MFTSGIYPLLFALIAIAVVAVVVVVIVASISVFVFGVSFISFRKYFSNNPRIMTMIQRRFLDKGSKMRTNLFFTYVYALV